MGYGTHFLRRNNGMSRGTRGGTLPPRSATPNALVKEIGGIMPESVCPLWEKTKQDAWNALQSEARLAARYYANDGIEHLAGDLFTA